MTTVVLEETIFLHIPKNAGTSISKWLRFHVNDQYNKIYYEHPLLSTVYNDLSSVKKYFVFTSVRNPWARALSGYQNLIRHFKEHRNDMMKNHVEEILQMNGSFPDVNRWIEILPYTKSMIGKDWNMLTLQIDWIKPGVDLVLRTEFLETDFKLIKDIFKNDKDLNFLNKSESNLDYRKIFNDKSKKIISKLYEPDIDTYKYIF